MKKIWSVLMGVMFCITACEKDPDERLEGKWQLLQIQTPTGVIEVDTIYYNFQTSLFMYQIYSPTTESYQVCYGFKKLINDDLTLELNQYHLNDEERLLEFVRNYTDWDGITRSFQVDEVNSSRLVLTSDQKTYTFRKF